MLLTWQDPGSDRIQQARTDNSHTWVFIPPGVKHAIENLGPGDCYLVAFRSPNRSGAASLQPSIVWPG